MEVVNPKKKLSDTMFFSDYIDTEYILVFERLSVRELSKGSRARKVGSVMHGSLTKELQKSRRLGRA